MKLQAYFALILLFVVTPFGAAVAQDYAEPAVGSAFRSTQYPLPRFVSIASDEVYVRAGPGTRYPVEWVYTRKSVPVEVILEYDVWRKIRDRDGETGWVHHTLLSGKRTAFITASQEVAVFKKPTPDAVVTALLEPEVIVTVEECASEWCRINVPGYEGWSEQKNLWGVYATEEFD